LVLACGIQNFVNHVWHMMHGLFHLQSKYLEAYVFLHRKPSFCSNFLKAVETRMFVQVGTLYITMHFWYYCC